MAGPNWTWSSSKPGRISAVLTGTGLFMNRTEPRPREARSQCPAGHGRRAVRHPHKHSVPHEMHNMAALKEGHSNMNTTLSFGKCRLAVKALLKQLKLKVKSERVNLAAVSYGALSHIPAVRQRTFGNEPCERKTERSSSVVAVARQKWVSTVK